MSDTRNTKLIATAIAGGILIATPSVFRAPSASAQQLKDTATGAAGGPVALYITLCLGSQQRPDPMCREVPVTPGAARLAFANVEACGDVLEQALDKWDEHAGSVFGFTATAGDGYRIVSLRCGRIVSGSNDGS